MPPENSRQMPLILTRFGHDRADGTEKGRGKTPSPADYTVASPHLSHLKCRYAHSVVRSLGSLVRLTGLSDPLGKRERVRSLLVLGDLDATEGEPKD